MSAPPLAVSVTSPLSNRQGKVVKVKQLHLVDIPDVMDKMGWTVSAKLMRHWFSIKPAWEMPKEIKEGKVDPSTLLPGQKNTSIVKLDWVLGFARVQPVLQELFDHWRSPAGVEELAQKLRRAKWQPGQLLPVSIGYGSQDACDLDALSQVNYRSFGSKLDPLDDLYGALGIGTLKLAVAGKTRYSLLTRRTEFITERVGIYVRDTYDFTPTEFEDWAPLGVWSRDRCLNKVETATFMALSMTDRIRAFPGFVPLYNDDFRRWQKANNAGGDFVVYSDFKWIATKFPPIVLP